MMKQQIHVIGGKGFIGAQLAASLSAQGHDVTIGTRPNETTDAERIADFRRLAQANDWIVHAASESTPASSANRPLSEVDGNLRTLACLVEALQSRPEARLLYLSSAGTTYADALSGHPEEGDRLWPRSFHGAAKVAAEQFLQVLASPGNCQVTVVRPSNVYGPGQSPRPGFGLISTAFARCLDGLPLPVFGDGSSTRDYLFIHDATDLLRRVIESPYRGGFDVFNAANGRGHRLSEILDLAERISGRPLLREFKPARLVDANCIVPDPGKAFRTFGWQARTSLEEGMTATWRWMQSISA